MAKSKVVYLSFPLAPKIPTYGQFDAELQIKSIKTITNGDSCNTFHIGLGNHWGTHVDAPKHFFADGQDIASFGPQTWIFDNPQMLNIQIPDDFLIRPNHILNKINKKTDFLIFFTGFCHNRNKPEYSFANPGIHSDTAQFLRSNYQNIRAVGIDSVSISHFPSPF